MKLGICLDDELLKRADTYAEQNYMSRSGLLSLALTQFLNSAEATKAIKEIAVCMRQITDNGYCDAETQKKLEEFESFAKILM